MGVPLVTRGDAKIDYRRFARACERYNLFSRHLPSPRFALSEMPETKCWRCRKRELLPRWQMASESLLTEVGVREFSRRIELLLDRQLDLAGMGSR